MVYVQYVYYAHLPLNKPTIHVGIIDHTHPVPGKLILPKTFQTLEDSILKFVQLFFSPPLKWKWSMGPGPSKTKLCWSQAVLCFY